VLLLTSSFSNETRPRVASWHLNVVRASKIALLAAGISAILVVGIFAVRLIFAWHHPPSAAPAASITLLGYTNITRSNPDSNVFVYPGRGEWLLARMILKNEGKGSILYKAWGDEPYGWANAQTGQGLTNGFLAPPFTGLFVVLAPGSNAVFSVWLPADTSRWQCGFSVYTPSVRERAVWRMISWKKFQNRSLNWLWWPCVWSLPLLPDESGPEVEVKSRSLEVDRGTDRSPRDNPDAANPANTTPLHSATR
jgi:hypothetical protein